MPVCALLCGEMEITFDQPEFFYRNSVLVWCHAPYTLKTIKGAARQNMKSKVRTPKHTSCTAVVERSLVALWGRGLPLSLILVVCWSFSLSLGFSSPLRGGNY